MIVVKIADLVGTFAENKDIATDLRENAIIPAVSGGDSICLDFEYVDSTTQSFIHALISEVFQNLGEKALEMIEFRKCSRPVRSLIGTVINYSLE